MQDIMGVNDIAFPNLGLYLRNVPQGFTIFGFYISLYGVIIAIGVMAGIALAAHVARKTGQNPDDYWDFAIYGVIFGVIGARIYYVVFEWDSYKDNLLEIFRMRNGGLAIYGGVIAAFITLFVWCRIKKRDPREIGDTAMAGLLLGQIIGRWGNFTNREVFGKYTDGLLAMRIPLEAVRDRTDITEDIASHITEGINYIQVHPTFFYESALILLLLLLLYTMLSQPRSFFLSSVELLVTAICPLFLLGTLWAAGIYYRWRRRSLRSVEEGGPLAAVPRSYRFLKYLSRVLLLLLALTLASIVLSPESSEDSFHLALILLLNLLISALLFPLLGWLERKGMSLGYRFLSAFLALLVILLCLGYCAPRLSLRANSPPPPSYTWDDREWDAEPQSLPLTVEDLTGKPWDHVRRNTYPDGRSPLTAQTAYGERAAREDGTEAYLYYSVLDAREGFVCRTIRAGLLDVSPAHAYSPEDPAPWGAEAVYRHFWNDGAVNTWLLVWPGRVARVHTEDTPEAEQKALIAARLAPEDWKEETT